MNGENPGPETRREDGRTLLGPGFGVNADEPAHTPLVFKLDDPGDSGEQRVVLAAAHVEPGFDGRSSLPDEYRAARHQLTGEPLDAKPLRVAVASVPRAAARFL